jgi:hypothetical protein
MVSKEKTFTLPSSKRQSRDRCDISTASSGHVQPRKERLADAAQRPLGVAHNVGNTSVHSGGLHKTCTSRASGFCCTSSTSWGLRNPWIEQTEWPGSVLGFTNVRFRSQQTRRLTLRSIGQVAMYSKQHSLPMGASYSCPMLIWLTWCLDSWRSQAFVQETPVYILIDEILLDIVLQIMKKVIKFRYSVKGTSTTWTIQSNVARVVSRFFFHQ